MLVRFASYILPLLLLAACSSQPSKVDEQPEQLVESTEESKADETTAEDEADEKEESENADDSAGADSMFKRGLILMKGKRYEPARDLWLAASERFPNYAGVWTNLGLSQYHLESYDEAKASLSKATEINPQFCAAHKTMGLVLRELGDFKGAESSYITAIECAPADGNVRRNLGILYDLYLLDGRRALEQYQAAKKLYFAKDKNLEIWITNLKSRFPDPEPEEPVVSEQPANGEGVAGEGAQEVPANSDETASSDSEGASEAKAAAAEAEAANESGDTTADAQVTPEQGASE